MERDRSRRRVYEIVFQKCEITAQNEPIGTLLRQNVLIGAERMRTTFDNAIKNNQIPATFDIDNAITHLQVQINGVIYLCLLLPEKIDLQFQTTLLINLFFEQLPKHFLCDKRQPNVGTRELTQSATNPQYFWLPDQ